MSVLDVRHASRLFVRYPGFTLVAVLTLALGIGATTAIFSVVDTVLLRATALPEMDRLVVVWETDRQSGTTREPGSLPDFLDYRDRARTVDGLAAFMASEVNFAPPGGEPLRLQALTVTETLLPMLGGQPAAGRTFTAADREPGSAATVILSASLAGRVFSGTSNAIGRDLRIDGRPHTVVGIMETGADFGIYQVLRAAAYSRSFADRAARPGVDLWLPLRASAQSLPRSTHPLFMVGRTREGPEAAQRELATIAGDLERAYPENAARGVFVEPLQAVVFGPVRPALLVLLAAVALVLLVACANVANLLLVRGAARRREVAVRLAIGATRWHLARQFVAEGILLTFAAGTLGVAIAAYGLRALVALAPADLPRIADAAIDLRVLGVTLLVALGAGFAFGLVPTLQARLLDLQNALRGEGSEGVSMRGERISVRSVLVVSEFALAVMLVIGASLLIQSFWRLHRVSPGFDSRGVLKAEYQLPSDRYPAGLERFPEFTEVHAFTRGLLARIERLPGVRAAAIAGNHPIDPGFTNSFSVVGREAESRSFPEVSIRRVTPGYLATMGVPLVGGRPIRDSDGTAAPPVVMINQAAAQRFFAGTDPVGGQILFWGTARTVIGIVGDERFQGLATPAPPAVYTPLTQTPSLDGAGVLLVRSDGVPSSLAAAVRAAVREQDPGLALFGLEPLDDTLARSVAERRFTMLVLGLLAGVSLLLAAIGIHGVLSYTVAQRTREIGIRVALGAQIGRLRGLVMLEGMRLAVTGAVLGVGGALALSRLLKSLLYGVAATDTLTYVAVPVLLCGVALLASYLPARRATQVDPLRAIRGM